MSIEYKTIRVPQLAYRVLRELQSQIAEMEYRSLPLAAQKTFDKNKVSLGKVIEAALDSLTKDLRKQGVKVEDK